MSFKNNIKQRNSSFQGLRSFKDTLPTSVKKLLTRKVIYILKLLITGNILLEMNFLKFVIQKHLKTQTDLVLVHY